MLLLEILVDDISSNTGARHQSTMDSVEAIRVMWSQHFSSRKSVIPCIKKRHWIQGCIVLLYHSGKFTLLQTMDNITTLMYLYNDVTFLTCYLVHFCFSNLCYDRWSICWLVQSHRSWGTTVCYLEAVLLCLSCATSSSGCSGWGSSEKSQMMIPRTSYSATNLRSCGRDSKHLLDLQSHIIALICNQRIIKLSVLILSNTIHFAATISKQLHDLGSYFIWWDGCPYSFVTIVMLA